MVVRKAPYSGSFVAQFFVLSLRRRREARAELSEFQVVVLGKRGCWNPTLQIGYGLAMPDRPDGRVVVKIYRLMLMEGLQDVLVLI